MKECKVLGVATVAASMMLLTSCLGDGNNTTQGSTYGVIDEMALTYEKVVYVSDVQPCYASTIANATDLMSGDCIYFAFSADYDDPVNQGQNKYLTIQVPAQGYRKVTKGNVVPYWSEEDTAVIRNKELTFSAVGGYQKWTIIKDRLIMIMSHPKASTDQVNNYEIGFNLDQEPTTIGEKRVYELFIRSTQLKEGEKAVGATDFDAAYDMGYFLDRTKGIEKSKGNNLINFRFNYIKEFDKDTVKATWDKTDIFTVEIPADAE